MKNTLFNMAKVIKEDVLSKVCKMLAQYAKDSEVKEMLESKTPIHSLGVSCRVSGWTEASSEFWHSNPGTPYQRAAFRQMVALCTTKDLVNDTIDKYAKFDTRPKEELILLVRKAYEVLQ